MYSTVGVLFVVFLLGRASPVPIEESRSNTVDHGNSKELGHVLNDGRSNQILHSINNFKPMDALQRSRIVAELRKWFHRPCGLRHHTTTAEHPKTDKITETSTVELTTFDSSSTTTSQLETTRVESTPLDSASTTTSHPETTELLTGDSGVPDGSGDSMATFPAM